ncbi:hypothetical protein ACH5RR_029532 [Cinchona calisaya]|uniref:Peripheral subunit-binding (PSBD) domain-containing protein n=1 Tax=Cinchona calisaya TaxID=153742 RepID=A0ABD2YU82_9GENT
MSLDARTKIRRLGYFQVHASLHQLQLYPQLSLWHPLKHDVPLKLGVGRSSTTTRGISCKEEVSARGGSCKEEVSILLALIGLLNKVEGCSTCCFGLHCFPMPKSLTVPSPAGTALTVQPLSEGGKRIVAYPFAKKLAKELGMDLRVVLGSGPSGIVVAKDIEVATTEVTIVRGKAVATVAAVSGVELG